MEFLVSREGPFPRAGHLGRGPHGLPRAMLASVLLQSCSQAPFSCLHVVLVIFPFSLFFSGDSLTSVVQICSVPLFTIDCPQSSTTCLLVSDGKRV